MFITNTETGLTFVNSKDIKVYPCGRRRTQEISTSNGTFSIPFDPEARLNTEANNRSASGLNGFTQTYVKESTANTLSLVIAGYLFNIAGADIIEKLGSAFNGTDIYANIRIQSTQLFSGFKDYNTWVLRNQTASDGPLTMLDLLKEGEEPENFNNYYFSGLSFTSTPLSSASTNSAKEALEIEGAYYINNDESVDFSATNSWGLTTIMKKADAEGAINPEKDVRYQQVISLHILTKANDTWQIFQPALLPKITHGEIEDSIKVGDVEASRISAPDIKRGDKDVPIINIMETNGKWQLQINHVNK
jgi:hypothetical protein